MLFLPIKLTVPLFNVARRPRPAPHFKRTMSKPVAPQKKCGVEGPPCQCSRGFAANIYSIRRPAFVKDDREAVNEAMAAASRWSLRTPRARPMSKL